MKPLKQFTHDFKLPLIVTAIAFPVALALVIAGATWIYMQDISGRRMQQRAEKLGSGLAVATCVVIAPFWFVAAAKVGKRRREARDAAKAAKKESQ